MSDYAWPIQIVIDVSSSMAGEPLRIAEEAVPAIIDTCSRYMSLADVVRFSVTTFAETATCVLPMTADADATCALPRLTAEGGTSYTAAFRSMRTTIARNVAELHRLRKSIHSAPLIIFITDGKPNDSPNDRATAWEELTDPGWRYQPHIVVFGVGSLAARPELSRYSARRGNAFVIENAARAADAFGVSLENLISTAIVSAEDPQRNVTTVDAVYGQRNPGSSGPLRARKTSHPVFPTYVAVDTSIGSGPEWIAVAESIAPKLMDACRLNIVLGTLLRFSLVSFDSAARTVIPMTDWERPRPPRLTCGGAVAYHALFRELRSRIDIDVKSLKEQGYKVFRPSVFLITGQPADDAASEDQAAWQDLIDPRWRYHPNVVTFGATRSVTEATARRYTAHHGRAFVAADGSAPATAMRAAIEVMRAALAETTASAARGSGQGLISDALVEHRHLRTLR